jgi:adenine-specific DNA-methyltransferase
MTTQKLTLEQAQEKGLTSLDVAAERRARLKELMPEAFAGDAVDFEQLKRALGEEVYAGKERYGLSWPGKAECMKVIQAPSIATLKPCREGSVNFDETENLFIEGDNLEVLKLLQKSYFGKVKMIYIDPPYNTGKEFIYPDKYSETLETYLAYTGQIDDEGRRFATDTDAGGRRHARWLNMMYPRLYLARNLLREDGVIFISIDDNEQANLKLLCDLVFGEENFVGTFPWRSRTAKADVPFGVSVDFEWVVCYAKAQFLAGREGERKYHKSDDYEDRWRLQDLTKNTTKEERPNSYFTLINPKNGESYQANENRTWSITSDTFQSYYRDGKIVFPGDYNFLNIKRPAFRVFEKEDKAKALQKYGTEDVRMSVSTYLPEKEVGRTETGSKEIRDLFGSQIFSYPKPTGLIKFFVQNLSEPDAIVIDFFAGSGTTADAVIQANAEDGGRRKFILVQLPERIREDVNEQKTAYEYCQSNGLPFTISALTQERIRRAAKKIAEEQNGKLNLDGSRPLDLGFKVFKLAASNFRIWEGEKPLESEDEAEQNATLLRMLEEHVDHLSQTSTPEDILYELLLKAGFSLTLPIEKRTMAGKDVYAIEDGAMLICLDKHLNDAVIDAMAATHPIRVICLDEGFQGNDQLKANAVQTFKSRSLHEDSEIVFRTV